MGSELPHENEVRSLIDGLIKVRDETHEDVERLTSYGKRNRLFIYLTVFSLIVDLFLTGYIYHANNKTNEIAHQARTNTVILSSLHTQDVQRCQTSNTFKAQDLQLWNFIIQNSTTSQNATPEQQQKQQADLARFKSFLAIHDGQQDCSKLP